MTLEFFTICMSIIAQAKWYPLFKRVFAERSHSYSLTAEMIWLPNYITWLVYGISIQNLPLMIIESMGVAFQSILVLKIMYDRFWSK